MSIEVIIDMQNSNALIAMAHVSQNANNPYAAFGEYIKYCIFSNSSKNLTLKEVRENLVEEFGLDMPNNILLKCLSDIQLEGIIEVDKHQINVVGDYSTETFEKKRTEFQKTEDALLEDLIKYVGQYDKVWDRQYAREQLVGVLDRNNLAYDIFLSKGRKSVSLDFGSTDEESCADDEEPLFSDEFYVGKYVNSILSTESVYKEYLQNVCEGLMICVGVYQLPTADAIPSVSQIKDTHFFFDTRLLLRYIGCANEAAVQAAKELVLLIQNNGGKIYYFPHTLEEMNNALEDAGKSLSNGNLPYDDEMRIYAASINNKHTVLAAKKANLRTELACSQIYLSPLGNYDDKERIRFGFDKNDLVHYMLSKLKWDSKVIENDAASIWETHMRRKGVYSEYCGTNERLPVFVTTNGALTDIVMKYKDDRRTTSSIANWKVNRLPIITDIRMTCRLWSPSVQGERLSLLYLSANAVAAQKPTQRYLNCVRELVEELKIQVPQYSNISLPAFFDDNVTEALFEKTKGDGADLNIGMFASTMSELTEWKAKEQEDEKNQIICELDKTSETLSKQTRDIIDGAIEKNANRMGTAGLVLHLVFWWPLIMTALFVAVSAIVSKTIENWHFLWIGIIPMLIFVVQSLLSSKKFEKMILGKVYPWAEMKYEKKIELELRKSELPYSKEIIMGCKENTEIIKKCKEIIM